MFTKRLCCKKFIGIVFRFEMENGKRSFSARKRKTIVLRFKTENEKILCKNMVFRDERENDKNIVFRY